MLFLIVPYQLTSPHFKIDSVVFFFADGFFYLLFAALIINSYCKNFKEKLKTKGLHKITVASIRILSSGYFFR